MKINRILNEEISKYVNNMITESQKRNRRLVMENNTNRVLLQAMQRLSNGEDPHNVFDECRKFHDGFAIVRLKKKYNYIDTNGNLLSQTWFDGCWDFNEGFGKVYLKQDKFNFIDTNGNILSKEWFINCNNFSEGFAVIQSIHSNYRCNYIDTNGNLLSKKWFFYCGDFKNGFGNIMIKVDNYDVIWKRIDANGKLHSKN